MTRRTTGSQAPTPCSPTVLRAARTTKPWPTSALRFDFTGLGESEGDFRDTNFSSNVADLVAAAQFLESEFEAPKILIGHSLGGAAVLQAAANIPSSAALVTIAAPSETSQEVPELASS